MSLDEINTKVRRFYANVDPGHSAAEMDEVVFIAYSKGEAHVNEQLRLKYGRDLNSFSGMAPYPSSTPANRTTTTHTVIMTQPPSHGGVVLQPASNPATGYPVMVVENGVQKIMYVQQMPPGYMPGTTAFSSSQQYPATYDQQQRKPQPDYCLLFLGLFACFVCFD